MALSEVCLSAAGKAAGESAGGNECGLDPEQQLTFTDQMEYSSFRAGAAAFSIGIYFGIQFVSNPFFSKLKETMERYQIDL